MQKFKNKILKSQKEFFSKKQKVNLKNFKSKKSQKKRKKI